MKKTQILRLLGVALTSVIIASCSNDIEQNEVDNKVDMSKTTTFKLSFANYNEDKQISSTRVGGGATLDSINLKPIELGHGIVAYPTLIKDKLKDESHKASTRSLGNESYTMLAYKNGSLVGEMKGTASDVGGTATFTPTSSNSNIQLAPGTYDFVCYTTNYITRNGNDLTIDNYNGGKALIGRAANIMVSGTKQEIPFTMKHVTARVRVVFNSLYDFSSFNAIIQDISADFPNKAIYNAATGVYGYTKGSIWASYAVPASSGAVSISSNYNYFMPQSDPSKLKIQINGTFYKQYVNITTNIKPDVAFTFNENESYRLRFFIGYDFIYLFSDGTTGHFPETTQGGGTKTAIGIVVSQSKRLAMGLTPAIISASPVDYSIWHNNDINNKCWDLPSEWMFYKDDDAGYSYTWLPSGSKDGTTVKATAIAPVSHRPYFPAFYYAAHYNEELASQGITLASNVGAGKWFLPTFGQLYKAFTNIGLADALEVNPPMGTNGTEGEVKNYRDNIDRMMGYAFGQVNGTLINRDFVTSSSVKTGYPGYPEMVNFNPDGNGGLNWETHSTPAMGVVYPFIKY